MNTYKGKEIEMLGGSVFYVENHKEIIGFFNPEGLESYITFNGLNVIVLNWAPYVELNQKSEQ